MKKKQPSPAGVSDIPPLRTLAPPSGHPPRGLAVSCGDRLGGVVEWGDGEFREMFSWGHDGHDGHGGHGGHMMVALVVAIMDGGGHMDGGRHSGGGDWVRACGRGGGDWVLATATARESDSERERQRERATARESDSERERQRERATATASPPSRPNQPTNQPHTPTVIWGSLGSRLTHQ